MSLKYFLNTIDKRKRSAVIDEVTRDCQTVFNCRSIESASEDYSEGSTFFIKASEAPRFNLEAIALEVFKKHTDGMQFDPATSGAEWWTQVIDSRDDIGFHWDRDYGTEEETGQHIYPLYATVTYLTDCGGPTVIMNKSGGADNTVDITGPITSFIASKPQFGKHIAFDGDLLHAAPSDLTEDDEHSGDEEASEDDEGVNRITLLVNVWVNHQPIQSVLFPEADSGELSTSLVSRKQSFLDFRNSGCGPEKTFELDAVNSSRTMEWAFNNSDVKYIVSAPLPEASTVTRAFEDHHCVEFKYTQEEVTVMIAEDENQDSSDEEGADSDEELEDVEEEGEEESDSDESEAPVNKRRRT